MNEGKNAKGKERKDYGGEAESGEERVVWKEGKIGVKKLNAMKGKQRCSRRGSIRGFVPSRLAAGINDFQWRKSGAGGCSFTQRFVNVKRSESYREIRLECRALLIRNYGFMRVDT